MKEALRIRKFPDPVLRKKAARIDKVTDSICQVLDDMAELMYLSQGVGLAAVQVGIDKQLAVIDVGEGLIKFINPVITRKSGTELFEEGCLSVPEVSVKVRRAKSVTVDYLNDKGEASRLDCEGLLARAVQHELDHLRGVLIIDSLNPVRKLIVKRRLKN